MEALEPPPRLDLSSADEWRVLVTFRGTPCGYLTLPGPGTTVGAGFLDAAVVRHADGVAAWEQFVEVFRRRLGAPVHTPRRPSCSVVICTHRRPDYIQDVLEALRRLDPPADEIIVVDNDPGERDCRRKAEGFGVRYVREDRRGLDNARNAGLRAARGELVAFVDDDCVPVAGWLRNLPELFDDPLVAAVTGPAFAYALDTPAQVRFEDQGGHMRGLHRRRFDWRSLTPIAASRAGAGLNMIFRRSLFDELGEVFPPELDAGTPTESGGDMYALYKVLRAGHRVVYDPATYVLHQHRPDAASLHRTIRGYGIGVSAVLTKLLVEERELAAPTVWYGLWWLYADAVRRGLAGRAEPVEVRIGWDYLRGGLRGPGAWLTARKRFRAAGPAPRNLSSGAALRRPPGARGGSPEGREIDVSVIVSGSDPGPRKRCLDALEREEVASGGLEVIVVDDAEPTRGVKNSGAVAARGALLLFLDADAVAEPDLVARHLAAHCSSERDRIVVGHSPMRPARRTLAALDESLRWHDHFETKRAAVTLTFADVLGSNVSLRRAAFERLGGFDAELDRLGRGAWDLGVRALQSGIEVVYEPTAVAVREAAPSARATIEEARRLGRGDALLAARHPAVGPSLPEPFERPSLRDHPLEALRLLAIQRLAPRWVAIALDLLEQVRARRTWLGLFDRACQAAYEDGASASGERRGVSAAAAQVLRVELNSAEPIPAPVVAPPLIELTLDGTPVGRMKPTGGQWHPYLADHAATVTAGRLHELPLQPLPRFEDGPRGRDLTGTAVVLGPARHRGDDRHRAVLEAAGASVEVVDGSREEHWAALDRAIRSSKAEIVGLPLPGAAAGPAWLASARVAFEGDRVAAAVGAALAAGSPAPPLLLGSRRTLPKPYTLLGAPSQYLIVRRPTYETLGGFDLMTVQLGEYGPVLDLLERALEAGYVIAHRDTPGLEPAVRSGRDRMRAAWKRHQARGGLLLRRARHEEGGLDWPWLARWGLLPLAADLYRSLRSGDPTPARAAASAAAFLSGCAITRRLRQPPVTTRLRGGALSASARGLPRQPDR